MRAANHIHAGSAVYSCRYRDIIGWKEKGIKTCIYNNVCISVLFVSSELLYL